MTDAGVLIARLRADVVLPGSRSRDAWWFFMDLGFARAGEFGFPAVEAPSSDHNHDIRVHCAMEGFSSHPIRGAQNHSSARWTKAGSNRLFGDPWRGSITPRIVCWKPQTRDHEYPNEPVRIGFRMEAARSHPSRATLVGGTTHSPGTKPSHEKPTK